MTDKILNSCLLYSKTLTDIVLTERPQADRGSVEVGAAVMMLIATIYLVNRLGDTLQTRAVIDELVNQLPRNIEDRPVNLGEVLPDSSDLKSAVNLVYGAYNTNVLGAFEAIYNSRVSSDIEQMSKLENGPFGPIAGVSVVVSKALLGESVTPDMMSLMEMFGKHQNNIFQSFQSSKNLSKSSAGSSSCFIATACYGSPYQPTVMTYRLFREAVLKRSSIGRYFVVKYYEKSPALAQLITEHQWALRISRHILNFGAFVINKTCNLR